MQWKLDGVLFCSVGFKFGFESLGPAIYGVEPHVFILKSKIGDCGIAISNGRHVVSDCFDETLGGVHDRDAQELSLFPHILGQLSDIVIYG